MDYKELENAIIEDWTWRKTEISTLILLAEDSKEEVVLKSIILLLYAHWEGYIKKCSRFYLKFIADNKPRISDLTDNFRAVALKGISKEIINSKETLTLQNELGYIKKYSKIDSHTIDHHLTIDLEVEKDGSIIDTNNNLNPAVFRNILDVVGLHYQSQYETREKYIENHLLANRNSIGHGNRKLANDDDFELEINSVKKLRDVIVSIIENFRDEIIEYSRKEYFRKENQDKLSLFLAEKNKQLEAIFKDIDSRYSR
jgi:DNA-binding ferritin-like protein (Dps family)